MDSTKKQMFLELLIVIRESTIDYDTIAEIDFTQNMYSYCIRKFYNPVFSLTDCKQYCTSIDDYHNFEEYLRYGGGGGYFYGYVKTIQICLNYISEDIIIEVGEFINNKIKTNQEFAFIEKSRLPTELNNLICDYL